MVTFIGGYYSEFGRKLIKNGCHKNFGRDGPVQGAMESGKVQLPLARKRSSHKAKHETKET